MVSGLILAMTVTVTGAQAQDGDLPSIIASDFSLPERRHPDLSAGSIADNPAIRSSSEDATHQPPAEASVKKLSDTGVELDVPGENLKARIDFASAGDVLRPGLHLLAGALSDQNSWRREVDFSLSPTALDAAGLTVSGGAFSGRRPYLRGYGTRHGVGEFTRWLEGSGWNLGLQFTVPGSGIRYSGDFAWTRYAQSWANRLDDPRDVFSPRPDWESSRTHWHRIDADLWKSGTGEASAYVLYGQKGDDFPSLRRRHDVSLIFEGTTFELGGKLKLGKSRFSFRHEQVDGPEIGFRETTGNAKFGPVDLEVVGGAWSIRNADLPGWSADDRFWKVRARLSLGQLLGGGFGKGILPDRLNFKAERKQMEDGVAGFQTRQQREKLGVGLSWSRKGSETEIYFSQTATDRPAGALGGPDRKREVAIDFFQTLYGDSWDVSVYGSYSNENARDSGSSYLNGGASFSLTGKKLPKMSFSIDVGSFDFRYPGLDFRNRNLSVQATFDLSRYLPRSGAEKKPYLLLKAYGDWSLDKESSLGELISRDDRVEPTVMLVFGKTF